MPLHRSKLHDDSKVNFTFDRMKKDCRQLIGMYNTFRIYFKGGHACFESCTVVLLPTHF